MPTVTLADEMRWALSHRTEWSGMYTLGKTAMADFPGLPGTPKLGHIAPRVLTPEDEKLKTAILALRDDEVVDEHHPLAALIAPHDKHIRGRLFGPRPPAPIDPATGQPVPQSPRFDGSLIKMIFQNLPGIIAYIPQLMELWKMLSGAFGTPATP